MALAFRPVFFHSFELIQNRAFRIVSNGATHKPGPDVLASARGEDPLFSSSEKCRPPLGPKFARRKFPALGYVFTPSFSILPRTTRQPYSPVHVTLHRFPVASAAASAATRAARLTGRAAWRAAHERETLRRHHGAEAQGCEPSDFPKTFLPTTTAHTSESTASRVKAENSA